MLRFRLSITGNILATSRQLRAAQQQLHLQGQRAKISLHSEGAPRHVLLRRVERRRRRSASQHRRRSQVCTVRQGRT